MKVDYLSDLHIDMYVRHNHNTEEIIRLYYNLIKHEREPGEVLIVAGDLGHYNDQNILLLKMLKENFYKYVVCVLGNHDYYLIDKESKIKYKDSFERVKEMRSLINEVDGMHCLDGNVVDIEGIKFGGCDSWYNGGYAYKYFKEQGVTAETISQLWSKNMNDSNFIQGIKCFDDIYSIEEPKLESVYKNVDVLVTHVNPSIENKNFSKRFENSMNNTFFSFDGEKYLKETTASHWVFGHSHELIGFEEHGVHCVANALGYPGESGNGLWAKMKSFEIEKI